MLEALSSRIAGSLKRAIPDHPVSEAVLGYGLRLILTAAATVALGTALGAATGRLPETWAVLAAFAVLRLLSGGYHFKSAALCVLVSAGTAAAIPLIHPGTLVVQGLNTACAALIAAYAPSRLEAKSRIPRASYPLLRLLSLLMVLGNFYIQSPLLALTWFVQAVSLIRRR